MNAVILCRGRMGVAGKPCSLVPLAGQPLLAYQLRALARLGLTRVVLGVGQAGNLPREVKEIAHALLPAELLRVAVLPGPVEPDSIEALNRALLAVEQTGVMVVDGSALFPGELAERLAAAEGGALPYRAGGEGVPVAVNDGSVAKLGEVGGPSAGSLAGLCFLPRAYLPALHGVIVALTAAGAGRERLWLAWQTLLRYGYRFRAVDASRLPYLEIRSPGDLPDAVNLLAGADGMKVAGLG